MKKIIAANVISGLSLVCLIVFGVSYLQFKNIPIYSDYTIEVINNPVTQGKDIYFAMVGTKTLDCQTSKVYGLAYNDQNYDTPIRLDRFTQAYIRNISPGQTVTNHWKLAMPDEMKPGIWRVDMIGDWTCHFWVFKEKTTRSYDNILLIVE